MAGRWQCPRGRVGSRVSSEHLELSCHHEQHPPLPCRECVVIRHPRSHEFAFGFITGEMTMQFPEGPQDLFTVFVPTNHVYIGDVFILKKEDVFHTDMTVRQGLEVVISCGMAVPSHIKLVDGSLPSPWKPQGPWHST